MSIALPLLKNEGPNPQIFQAKAFKHLLTEESVQELKKTHSKCLAAGVWTEFILAVLLSLLGANLKDFHIGDASLLLWINLTHTIMRVLKPGEKSQLNDCSELIHNKLQSKYRYPQRSEISHNLIPVDKQDEVLTTAKETIRAFYRDNFKSIQALIEKQNEKSFN